MKKLSLNEMATVNGGGCDFIYGTAILFGIFGGFFGFLTGLAIGSMYSFISGDDCFRS